MSEPDKYDKDATEIVKVADDEEWQVGEVLLREAVAARLRADGAEIERLHEYIRTRATLGRELCEQLGIHTSMPNTGCFGDDKCPRCFQIGFAVLKQREDLATELSHLRAQLANRCDHCGAKVYSGPPDCFRCGAPNCCPQCCEIDTLRAQLAALHGKIMNIPYPESNYPLNIEYRMGHRDARHAAAELCAAMAQAGKGEG